MTAIAKTLFKDISLKDGTVLKKGTKVRVYPKPGNPSACDVDIGSRTVTLRWTSVIKSPSLKCLESWIMDGVAESVIGCGNIEPDGYDSRGFPSWLLAVGFI